MAEEEERPKRKPGHRPDGTQYAAFKTNPPPIKPFQPTPNPNAVMKGPLETDD